VAGSIKVMSESLASRIAAGEVVERPASVVKELLENSLDAGSTSIDVEVSLSKRRIRIKDNGCGIASGDIEKALARHGTSKVYKEDDIFGISTFGFRGEALPSIASVSRFSLSTFDGVGKSGRKIRIEGGKTIEIIDSPPLQGTEIIIENLFFNTPARKKFMRSHSTEMSHITAAVIQSALAFPSIRFSFIKDGKRMLELSKAEGLKERVRQIFGNDYQKQLLEANCKYGDIEISGLIGKPSFNRATSIDQYFFVNERPLKDSLIRMAVARAFLDLVPKGRKAILFLKLNLPFDLVDVNVHPTKAEVRFSDPGRVASAIEKGIRETLGKSAVPVFLEERSDFNQPASASHFYPSQDRFSPAKQKGFERSFEIWSEPHRELSTSEGAGDAQGEFLPAHGRLSNNAIPIGQLFKTFLLIEEGERLIVLDQHTVHERILFERFMKKYSSKNIERQKLLLEETFDAGVNLADTVRSHLKTFFSLGWLLEEYGETAFVIREVPALLVEKEYAKIVKELCETIQGNRKSDFKVMMSHLISTMACRAAVKSGDTLSNHEVTAMIDELRKVELPYTCPHGRPVALEIERNSINRDFGRPN